MERFSLEVKVGLMVVITAGLVLAFIFILGEWNPFTNTYRIMVTLRYAGGIKPGSDVHLAGAKVGKVDARINHVQWMVTIRSDIETVKATQVR